MLNILWPIFIILSVIYGLIYGKADEINNGIFESLSDAIELSITFLGTISLWNGIMEICKKTSLMDKLTGFLKPFINFLFPELKKNEIAKQEISMNMIANILGLGNAATPFNDDVYSYKYSFNTTYSNKCNSNKNIIKFRKSHIYYCSCMDSYYYSCSYWYIFYKNFN